MCNAYTDHRLGHDCLQGPLVYVELTMYFDVFTKEIVAPARNLDTIRIRMLYLMSIRRVALRVYFLGLVHYDI